MVPSFLYPGDGTWVSNDQKRVITQSEAQVAPGSVGTFTFNGKIPLAAGPGYVNVYFSLFHKTRGLISAPMYFTVKIGEPVAVYSASINRISPPNLVTLAPGDTYNFLVSYLNTGNREWKDASLDAGYVELRSTDSTGNPANSYLYPGDNTWISNDTISVVSQNAATVASGENTWFLFTGKVPADASAGVVNVYFRMWHKTGGYIGENINFPINVQTGGQASASPVVTVHRIRHLPRKLRYFGTQWVTYAKYAHLFRAKNLVLKQNPNTVNGYHL